MLRIASTLTAKRLSAVVVTTTVGTIGGTVAYCNSTERHKNYTLCSALQQRPSSHRNSTVEGSSTPSVKVHGLKVEKIDQVNENGDENIIQQIRPILQASQRALRLIQTVAMIVLEYKLDSYQHQLNTSLQSIGLDNFVSIDRNELMRQNLERDVQTKLDELQEAQRIYAEPNHNSTEEDKVKNRKAVHDAAEKLSEVEKILSDFTNNIADASNFSTTQTNTTTVHERAATRLRDLCRVNGGTYIKVGQHIANLDHILPEAYISVLQSLFCDCPITSYDDVREVVREELGDYPEKIFEEFEKEPIASASLAQVHVAKEKDTGRKLAIKVQHRGLRETSKGDLLALEYVVRIVDRLFDEFKWGWLVDEISPNVRMVFIHRLSALRFDFQFLTF